MPEAFVQKPLNKERRGYEMKKLIEQLKHLFETLQNTIGGWSKKKKWVVGGTSLGAVSIILVAALLFTMFPLNSFIDAFSNAVTISFDTKGGNEIAPVSLSKGASLENYPTAAKSGFQFIGWYHDASYEKEYRPEDVFAENETLHACYTMAPAVDNAQEYVKDCGTDLSFTVKSDYGLTTENINDYLALDDLDKTEAILKVDKTEKENQYKVSALGGFAPGSSYTVSLRDPHVIGFTEFNGEDVSADNRTIYSFSIEQDSYVKSDIKDTVAIVPSDKVIQINNAGGTITAYLSGTDEILVPGVLTVIKDSNGLEHSGKVISVTPGKSIENQTAIEVVLDPVEDISEIYNEFEAYIDSGFVFLGEDSSIEETKTNIESQLVQSRQMEQYVDTMLVGMKNSPDVVTQLEKVSEEERQSFLNIRAADLGYGPNGSANVTSMGIKELLEPKGKINLDYNPTDSGMTVSMGFTSKELTFPIGSVATVKLQFSINTSAEVVIEAHKMLLKGKTYTDLDGNTGKYKGNYAYTGAIITNETTVSFSASISYGASEEGKVEVDFNLAEQIQNALASDSVQSYMDTLNQDWFDQGDLDYENVVSVDLFKFKFTCTGIESIQFKLSLNVNLGASVALKASVTNTCVARIATSNGRAIYNYDNENHTPRQQYILLFDEAGYDASVLKNTVNLKVAIQGKIGIQVGLNLNISLSAFGLNDIASIGIYGEVGAYAEFSGYAQFELNLVKVREYPTDITTKMSGGFSFETGIYLKAGFTWDALFWGGEWEIASMKFPLWQYSSDKLALDFVQPTETIVVNGNFDLFQKKEWLDYSTIDLKSKITATQNLKDSIAPLATTGKMKINEQGYTVFNDKVTVALLPNSEKGTSQNDIYQYLRVVGGASIQVLPDAPDRLDFDVLLTSSTETRLSDGKPLQKRFHVTYIDPESAAAGLKASDVDTKYTTYFKYRDGTDVIEPQTLYIGQMPHVPLSDIVTKQILEQHLWEFDEGGYWKDDQGKTYEYIPEVTRDVIYTVNDKPAVATVSYAVRGMDSDQNFRNSVYYPETVIKTEEVQWGDTLSPPSFKDQTWTGEDGIVWYFSNWNDAVPATLACEPWQFSSDRLVYKANLSTDDMYAGKVKVRIYLDGKPIRDYADGEYDEYPVGTVLQKPDTTQWQQENPTRGITGWTTTYRKPTYLDYRSSWWNWFNFNQELDESGICEIFGHSSETARAVDIIVDNKNVGQKILRFDEIEANLPEVPQHIPVFDRPDVAYREFVKWELPANESWFLRQPAEGEVAVNEVRAVYQDVFKENTILFNSLGFKTVDNAPLEYKGANENRTDLVPDQTVTNFIKAPDLDLGEYNFRKTEMVYPFYWEATDATGKVIQLKPGDNITFYQNLTFFPVFEYQVQLSTPKGTNSFHGKFGEVLTEEQVLAWIQERFPGEVISEMHAVNVVPEFKLPYTFGSSKKADGSTELSVMVNVSFGESLEVTFDAVDGHFADGAKTKKVAGLSGKNVNNLNETPVKEGYVFNGWSPDRKVSDYDPASGDDRPQWMKTAECIYTGNKTYYAVYDKVPENSSSSSTPESAYTIYFSSGNGTFAGGSTSKSIQLKAGEKIRLADIPAPSLINHTFEGWIVNGSGAPVSNQTAAGMTITQNMTLKASFKANTGAKVNVTFRSLDGSLSTGGTTKTITVVSGNVLLASDIPTATMGEKWIFKGWIVNENQGTIVSSQNLAKMPITQETVLDAYFERDNNTVDVQFTWYDDAGEFHAKDIVVRANAQGKLFLNASDIPSTSPDFLHWSYFDSNNVKRFVTTQDLPKLELSAGSGYIFDAKYSS